MFAALKKIFSRNHEHNRPLPIVIRGEASTETSTEVEINCISWTKVDQTFIEMLLGIKSLFTCEMSDSEKSSLLAIHKQYLQGSMPENRIPRLPGIIPKLMLALRDNSSNARDLAELLSADVVLVSDVIGMANSAYYSRSQTYDSLQQAIVNIGFNGIRQITVSAAMKPILNTSSGHFADIASNHLWDKSMSACLLSDCAAKKLHEDRFHAYLASLTMQSGMTMLSRELDHYFTSETVPSDRAFADQLNHYALEISCLISQQWKFPEAVTSALQEQVDNDDPSKMSKLGTIIFLSDKLAKIHLMTKNGYLKSADTDVTKRMPNAMARVFSDCLNLLEEDSTAMNEST